MTESTENVLKSPKYRTQ